MKWLLFDSCCIETTETASAVIRRVQAAVDDFDSNEPGKGQPLFEGSVRGDEFQVFRIIGYKNLLLPLIWGKVLSTPEGTIVKVKMRPHGFALTSLSVWYGVTILLPLYPILTGQGDGSRWLAGQVAGLIPAVLVWLLAVVLFGYEARRGREALDQVVRGAEPDAAPDRGGR
jgi:hypothetical protein